MENEMIERVAKAIYDAQHFALDRETLENMARAAIAAMREPGLEIRKITTFEFAEVEWPKLIDAALAAPPVGG